MAGESSEVGAAHPPSLSARLLLWLLFAALGVVLVVYGSSLVFGLYWDDYQVLRPLSAADLHTVWTGIYRPEIPSAIFYRPLASAYYAAAFDLFGVNALPLHALCLVDITIISTLAGVFVFRETRDVALALVMAMICAAQPDMASSIGPWIANQDQAFAAITVLTGLLWWQTCRSRSWPWWIPLIAAAAITSWFKEDGLMLPLLIPVLHMTQPQPRGRQIAPSLEVSMAGAALFLALMAWRWQWLGGLGGYAAPPIGAMLRNMQRGPRDVLFRMIGPAQATVWPVLIKLAGLAGAALAWLRDRHSARARLAAIGAAMIIVCDLPLSQVSSGGRWYLLGLGAAFLVTGGIEELSRLLRERINVAAAALVLTAAIGVFVMSSRAEVMAFGPCTAETIERDANIVSDPLVPAEIRSWLASPSRDCAVPAGRALAMITYGVTDAPGDSNLRQSSPTGFSVLVRDDWRKARLTMRHPAASPAAPVDITIDVDGRRVAQASFTSPGWREIDVPMPASTVRVWLRRARLVTIRIENRQTAGLDVRPVGVQ